MSQFAIVVFLLLLAIPSIVQAQDDLKVVLVAISVRDIDSTASWYKKYLGFALTDKKDFPDYKVSVGMLQKGDVHIELVRHQESIAPSSVLPKLDNPAIIRGYGKIAYEVDDIGLTVRTLKADGVKFITDLKEGSGKDFAGRKNCIVLDCDANWVQLFQRK